MSKIAVGANARELALENALFLVKPETQQKVRKQLESLYGSYDQMFAKTQQLLSKQIEKKDQAGVEATKDVLALIYLEREIYNAYKDGKTTIEQPAFDSLREKGLNASYSAVAGIKWETEKKRKADADLRAKEAEEKRLASRTPYQQALEEEIPKGPDCVRDRNEVTDFLNKEINKHKGVDGKDLTITQKITLIENKIEELPWYQVTPISYKSAIAVLNRQQEIEAAKKGAAPSAPEATPEVEAAPAVAKKEKPVDPVAASANAKADAPAEAKPKKAKQTAAKALTGEKDTSLAASLNDDALIDAVLSGQVVKRGMREEEDGIVHAAQRSVRRALGELAYGDDGAAGKCTDAAIKQVQRDYGLNDEGVIGRNTLLALQVEEVKKMVASLDVNNLTADQKVQLEAEMKDVQKLQDAGIALSEKGSTELNNVIAKLDGKITQSDTLYAVVTSVKTKTNQIS